MNAREALHYLAAFPSPEDRKAAVVTLYSALDGRDALQKACRSLLTSLESWHRTLMTVDGTPLSEIPKQFEELTSVQEARKLLDGDEDG